MIHELLHMGWPTASVLIAAILGLTTAYGIRKGE